MIQKLTSRETLTSLQWPGFLYPLSRAYLFRGKKLKNRGILRLDISVRFPVFGVELVVKGWICL